MCAATLAVRRRRGARHWPGPLASSNRETGRRRRDARRRLDRRAGFSPRDIRTEPGRVDAFFGYR